VNDPAHGYLSDYDRLVILNNEDLLYEYKIWSIVEQRINQNQQIAEVFPQENKMQRRYFQLLKNAYIDARYSKHYEITREELQWLADRVERLQELTERLCRERMANFK